MWFAVCLHPSAERDLTRDGLDPVLHELLTKGQASAAKGLLIAFVVFDALAVLVVLWAAFQDPMEPLRFAYSAPLFLVAVACMGGWLRARDPLNTDSARLIRDGEGLRRAYLREERLKGHSTRMLSMILVKEGGKELPVHVPQGQGEAVMAAMRRQHPTLDLG